MELKITPSGQTIVKPTALGPGANTDTKLLIYGLFQKGRVLAQDAVVHLIRQHVDATTFPASLTHAPTMQELASVRRFLDGLCSGSNDDSASAAPLLRLIRRVDISPGSVSILLDRNAFAACLSMGPERIREDALRILAPFRLRRRGVETKLVLGNPTKSVDRTLLRNIANAFSWLDASTLASPREARILGHEHADPTLDVLGRRRGWLDPA